MMLALEIAYAAFFICLVVVVGVTILGWVYAFVVLWADDDDDYLGDQIRGDER